MRIRVSRGGDGSDGLQSGGLRTGELRASGFPVSGFPVSERLARTHRIGRANGLGWVSGLAVAAVVLGGCASGDGGTSTDTSSPATTTPTATLTLSLPSPTGTSPAAPSRRGQTHSCPEIALPATSGEQATRITATGVGCEEADTLIRTVHAGQQRQGQGQGPVRRIDVGDYRCRVNALTDAEAQDQHADEEGRRAQHTLYVCTRGGVVITWLAP